MDAVGGDEIQTNQARGSMRQMIEEFVVKEAERTIRTCDILIESSTSAINSSVGIQSFSSKDDTSVPTDNVSVTVTHAFSTAKVSRLLQKQNRIFKENFVLDSPDTDTKQYAKYIELSRHEQLQHDYDSLGFWKKYSSEFPVLAMLAERIISIPASSAPVKRVFSQGGIIIRQHRLSMTSNTCRHF